MKALRALRTLTILSPKPYKTPLYPPFLYRFYSAQPQEDEPTNNPTLSDSEDASDSVFDSTHYTIPSIGSEPSTQVPQQPTWDRKYRQKADELIFGEDTQKRKLKILEEEDERRRRVLAKALLEAALEAADDDEDEEEDMVVKEEDQKSLSVGIIGVPNAGKSALTNSMVGFLAIDSIFECGCCCCFFF
jgi:GTP-binding protein Era